MVEVIDGVADFAVVLEVVDLVVVLPDAVEIRWGVKPCGELVMTKVVVSAGLEEVKDREVEGAGVVGDRSSLGVSDKLLVVGFSVVVLLVLLPDTMDIR